MKRKRVVMVARRKLLRSLISDPEWSRMLDGARTREEVITVLIAYASAKGLKRVDVDLDEGEKKPMAEKLELG